ncbi:hypothetical protein LINPERHAP1_LOCUS21890 [Linum perenne]
MMLCCVLELWEHHLLDIDCVNLQRLLKTNEPFVLANQASQIFFVDDKTNKNWHVVIRVEPRDTYALPVEDESINLEDHNEEEA